MSSLAALEHSDLLKSFLYVYIVSVSCRCLLKLLL